MLVGDSRTDVVILRPLSYHMLSRVSKNYRKSCFFLTRSRWGEAVENPCFTGRSLQASGSRLQASSSRLQVVASSLRLGACSLELAAWSLLLALGRRRGEALVRHAHREVRLDQPPLLAL